MTNEHISKKYKTAARAIVDFAAKLNTAIETYIDSGTQLGLEVEAAGLGSPLNRVRLQKDVTQAVLSLLPAAKLPGAKAAQTQAKFSRGLRLADIEITKRV